MLNTDKAHDCGVSQVVRQGYVVLRVGATPPKSGVLLRKGDRIPNIETQDARRMSRTVTFDMCYFFLQVVSSPLGLRLMVHYTPPE